ncbi:TPA: retron St85 family RNA-directed DNA polymerase [Vibrio parahaemolyticus]|uniref:retron St85 family RNA-directed DNA polymerase n=1 Tax=Vibrio parahaemolyticus TaxID=670 RepID=UPI000424F7EE|nr:retron St85 family RNA-directed DNA polymerase [Vibrio parahaemolyticus]EGQ7776646.1 RNA-directed DNA polymerase [Vibrio parahaemolyticus]EGQ8398159.1 RNA-directed DNA polymerase [Vibrio parahaemolyticus]EGQ9047925.1 RNA-directed DNA polymerase [Vibrio parahaemolyticus]EGQ9146736.1 RNA-directed DNA polymerase [Vibrio parahaemolyticus]EGQ9587297.1 RNA-directed DNA polymerase [Vibrio parahaemolyticus]
MTTLQDSKNLSRLKNLGLPPVTNLDELSSQMRLSTGLVQQLVYKSDDHYKVYHLDKKTGGKREIAQPSRAMKAAQSWILRNVLSRLNSSQNSKGFEIGESILSNAAPHVGAHVLLNIDLEVFFHSVPASHVYSIFHSIGYNKSISHIFTCLCTFNGRLPQGAPTSPKLSNLACQRLDSRIQGYSGPKGIMYTRYADDITLSAFNEAKIRKAQPMIEEILQDEGFILNPRKTKICGTRKRKEVTGLVISTDSVGIGRKKYRQMRAEIYTMLKSDTSKLAQVNGWLAYIKSVDESNFNRLIKYIIALKNTFPNNDIFDSIPFIKATSPK